MKQLLRGAYIGLIIACGLYLHIPKPDPLPIVVPQDDELEYWYDDNGNSCIEYYEGDGRYDCYTEQT